MTQYQQIAALEEQVERHHLEQMAALNVSSLHFIKALPEQEQIDWAAVASAKVEYEMPIGNENRAALGAKYLEVLRAYVETWVNKKASS